MYVPKQKTTVTVEDTFVLLKPHAAQHHEAMLQEFYEHGFKISMKSFTISKAVAHMIVSQYADVKAQHARVQEESAKKKLKGSSSALKSSLIDAEELDGTGSPTNEDNALKRTRVTGPGKSLTEEIFRLAKLDVDSPQFTMSEAYSSIGSLPHQQTSTVSQTGLTALPTPLVFEAMKEDYIEEILKGGTCLALVLTHVNAVEKCLHVCGPEDVLEARRAAPKSLRAKYGEVAPGKLQRNAVFCAPTFNDAAKLITAVFNIDITQRKNVTVVAPKTHSPKSNKTASSNLQDNSTFSFDVDALHIYESDDDDTALIPQELSIPKSPKLHLKTPAIDMNFNGSLGGGNRNLAEVEAAQQQAARNLSAEKHTLQFEKRLLRAREIDLLLREKQLQRRIDEANGEITDVETFAGVKPDEKLPHYVGRHGRAAEIADAVVRVMKILQRHEHNPVAVVQDAALLRKIFDEFDKSKNGRMEVLEFRAFFRAFPPLWQMGLPDEGEQEAVKLLLRNAEKIDGGASTLNEALSPALLKTKNFSFDVFALTVMALMRK